MKKNIRLTEKDLKRIINSVIKETVDVHLSDLRKYVPLLQMINNKIDMKDVILWFNENNVDYIGLNDLEMIIIYIARNS